MLNVRCLTRHVIASGNFLPEVRVGGIIVSTSRQGIGHVIIAQSGGLVKFEHKDAARPRAIAHPQLALLVIEHTGINVVGPNAPPLAAFGIARRKRRLRTEHNFEIGVLIVVGVGAVESGYHHRTLIEIRPRNLVGSEQDNARSPLVTIDAQILAPLLHRGVIDDVGSPEIIVHLVAHFGFRRPFLGIESREIHLLAAFFYLFHRRSIESNLVRHGVSGSTAFVERSPRNRSNGCPVAKVVCLGLCTMRAKDVILFTVGIPHHRGVVHAHPGRVFCGVVCACLFLGHLRLCRHWCPSGSSQ